MDSPTSGETPGQIPLSTAIRVVRPPRLSTDLPENPPDTVRTETNCNMPSAPALAGPRAGDRSDVTGEPDDRDDGDAQRDAAPAVAASTGFSAGRTTSWVNGYTSEEIAQMQRADPDLKTVLDWLDKSPQRPSRDMVARHSPATRNLWLLWQQLVLQNGVLYKRWETSDRTKSYLQLVVPQQLQSTVLQACHNSITSAHLGVKKTIKKTKRQFYWYRLKESVREWIKKCAKCGARKRPQKTPRAPLGDYHVGAPMDRLVTDILGPLPVTERGNKYILLVGDHFTRWMEAYPIPDQTAETVAHRVVYDFISRFGAPLDIHSDQGRTYESNLFKQVCKLLDIHKTRTTPYHPSSNGQAERFNQVLVNMIAAYVDEDQRNWDAHLPLLTSAYRSCEHETTGYTPNMLMLGRETHAPINLLLGCSTTDEDQVDECDYVSSLRERMTTIHHLTRKHLGKSAIRQKRDHDPRVAHHNYAIGDLVYVRDSTKTPGLSPKLKPAQWKGPCIIQRVLSDLLFEIRSKQRGKATILHHDRLKRYYSDDVPQWMRDLQKNLLRNGSPSGTTDLSPNLQETACTDNGNISNRHQSPAEAAVPPSTRTEAPTQPPPRRSSRTTRQPARYRDFV